MKRFIDRLQDAWRQNDSLVTVAVEHFIDRAALAEIEKVWKTTEGA